MTIIIDSCISTKACCNFCCQELAWKSTDRSSAVTMYFSLWSCWQQLSKYFSSTMQPDAWKTVHWEKQVATELLQVSNPRVPRYDCHNSTWSSLFPQTTKLLKAKLILYFFGGLIKEEWSKRRNIHNRWDPHTHPIQLHNKIQLWISIKRCPLKATITLFTTVGLRSWLW